MTISSDQAPTDGPVIAARGVQWARDDFPGTRTLLAYDGEGQLVLEARIRCEVADAETELAAWRWLDARYPDRPAVEPLKLA